MGRSYGAHAISGESHVLSPVIRRYYSCGLLQACRVAGASSLFSMDASLFLDQWEITLVQRDGIVARSEVTFDHRDGIVARSEITLNQSERTVVQCVGMLNQSQGRVEGSEMSLAYRGL